MGFTPTYDDLDERQPWENRFYNTLIDDLQTFANALTGADFAAPLILSKSGQDLDGGDHFIYGFKRWLGHGTDISVRDVTAFGATGGGAADDATAIQAAIDDLPTTGGVVLFPPGTYLVGTSVQMRGTGSTRDNVTLLGFGRSSVLKMDDGADVDVVTVGASATGMTIENLRITGNSANQTLAKAAINGTSTAQLSVRYCAIDDMLGDGVILTGAQKAQVTGCRIIDCTQYGIAHLTTAGGVYVLIRDNYIENALIGIYFIYPPSRTTVVGNIVAICDRNGMVFTGQTATFDDLVVSGNVVHDCGQTGGTLYDGIQVQGATAGTCHTITVSNNVCASNDRHGIHIFGAANQAVAAFAVNGNTCYANGGVGIEIGTRTRYGTVQGNTCFNNDGDAGIVVNGIASHTAQYISITGNACSDDRGGSAAQNYGIHLGSQSENCAVIANTLFGNSVANILDEGTDNDIAHNPGF